MLRIVFFQLYKMKGKVSQKKVIYTMRQRILLLRPMRQREREKIDAVSNDGLDKLISTFDGN